MLVVRLEEGTLGGAVWLAKERNKFSGTCALEFSRADLKKQVLDSMAWRPRALGASQGKYNLRSEGIPQAGNKRGLWGKQASFQVAEGHPPKMEGWPRAKSEEVWWEFDVDKGGGHQGCGSCLQNVQWTVCTGLSKSIFPAKVTWIRRCYFIIREERAKSGIHWWFYPGPIFYQDLQQAGPRMKPPQALFLSSPCVSSPPTCPPTWALEPDCVGSTQSLSLGSAGLWGSF